MGLEFSFDEISLDQQASSEQLEIDLYDELVTIAVAEPEEQVRLLATTPAPMPGRAEPDKPESIRVTGSLGKEQFQAGMLVAPAEIPVQTEAPIPAPQLKAMPPEAPEYPHARAPLWSGDISEHPAPTNGERPHPLQPAGAVREADKATPPPKPQVPPHPQDSQPRPKAPPVPPVLAAPPAAPAVTCPDCGREAGELDMICIECGAFIG